MAKKGITMDEIIDKLNLQRPEGKPPKKGMIFCPYCGEWTSLVLTEGYHRTKCCSISSEDFYIKYFNHLWKK